MLPHFSRSDRRALLIVACVLLLVAAAGLAVHLWWPRGEGMRLTTEEQRMADSLAQRMEAAERQRMHRYPRSGGVQQGELFPFDPNHDDSLTLLRLGLRPWQVGNMMKYRRKQGRWRSPDDFRRLYGLSEADFQRLRPYIRIAPEDQRHSKEYWEDRRPYPYGVPKGDRATFEHVEKYPEGTQLAINEADTTELKRIPGIGSYYASKIVRYRERLGGFISVRQIDEVEGLPPGISRWFKLGPRQAPHRLRINHATFKQLYAHPYLNYEQTKDIVNHIRRYGPLRSLRDLRLYKEFSDDDLSRLAPYVTFD